MEDTMIVAITSGLGGINLVLWLILIFKDCSGPSMHGIEDELRRIRKELERRL